MLGTLTARVKGFYSGRASPLLRHGAKGYFRVETHQLSTLQAASRVSLGQILLLLAQLLWEIAIYVVRS